MSCTTRTLYFPQDATYCKLSGNANLYGLGIRLGTYLVWTVSIISQHISRSEANSMRTLSALYQLATMLALLISTPAAQFGPGLNFDAKFFALEAWILLSLVIGGLFTSTNLTRIPHFSRSSSPSKLLRTYVPLEVSDLGGLLRLILLPASAGYGAWFAFKGVAKLCQACTNQVFFFAETSLHGWYRTLLKALFVIDVMCVVVLLGWTLAATLIRRKQNRGKETIQLSLAEEERPGVVSLLVGIVMVVLFILAIELTIFWNNILDVNSCGSLAQLIPLVVGAGALCRILYAMSSDPAMGKIRLRLP